MNLRRNHTIPLYLAVAAVMLFESARSKEEASTPTSIAHCIDFERWEEAQIYYNNHRNERHLDPDDDSIACEWKDGVGSSATSNLVWTPVPPAELVPTVPPERDRSLSLVWDDPMPILFRLIGNVTLVLGAAIIGIVMVARLVNWLNETTPPAAGSGIRTDTPERNFTRSNDSVERTPIPAFPSQAEESKIRKLVISDMS
jgi:hypothetical protein